MLGVLGVLIATGIAKQRAEARATARFDATVTFPTDPTTTSAAPPAFVPPTVHVTWPTGRPLRMLVVGDSIAAGHFATTDAQAFPQVVTRVLERHGAVSETTLAAPGQTAGYFADTSFPASDLAVIELGTNDDRSDQDATPLPTFTKNYRAVIAAVRRAAPAAKLVCLGIWRRDSLTSQAIDGVISQTCTNGIYVPVQSIYDDDLARGPAGRTVAGGVSDDFHPNDRGHAEIADAIIGSLRF